MQKVSFYIPLPIELKKGHIFLAEYEYLSDMSQFLPCKVAYFTDPFQERGSAAFKQKSYFYPFYLNERDLKIELCKYFNASAIILWSLLNYFKKLYSLFIVRMYTQSDDLKFKVDPRKPDSALCGLLSIVQPCALDSTSVQENFPNLSVSSDLC